MSETSPSVPSQNPSPDPSERSGALPQSSHEETGLITQSLHEHEGHRHFYRWGATTVHGLKEAICSCGHGLQVHPSVHDIAEGKITDVE
jgi:hypothetical protein